MHTASQLSSSLFAFEIENRPAELGDLFPNWTAHDRFGILLHEPYGALGASLLIQAVVARFFEHRHDIGADHAAMYPEIYAFHVGGRYGDHSMFDFWPGQKEIEVPRDPAAVLHAINERAITRLAVPETTPSSAPLLWPELGSARNRIRSSVVYGATGEVEAADVVVRGTSPVAVENPEITLELPDYAERFADSEDPDTLRWVARVRARSGEISDTTRAAIRQGRRRTADGVALERYRRAELEQALARLVPPA